ncbi:MAG: hypothetical protein GWP91_14500 [Rhodobacterales bacterium]|nr:hypothetical protein [Rhodobacterales bacterium]
MILRSMLIASLFLPAIAHAGFGASSFKKDNRKGENFYNAGSALDSNLESCWLVDPEAKNEGSWIEMDLPAGEVDKLGVVIGWDKDENTFGDYARVKSGRLEIFSKTGGTEALVGEATLNFEDKRGWQVVDLPDTKVGDEMGAGRIRFTVTDTYSGKDYPNLALSEIRLFFKEFEAGTLSIKTYPADEAEGHTGDLLADGNDRTFWASAGGTEAELKLKGSGYGLSSVGIKAGPKPYARPKTIELVANDMIVRHTMEDNDKLQWLLLPVVVGYTGSAWGTITVKVIDAYEGEKGVAIAEVKLNAATIEDI